MKNELIKKVLNTGKKIALGASLIVSPYLGFSQATNDGFINLKEAGQSKNISLVKVNGNKYDFKFNKKSDAEFGIEACPAMNQSDILSIAKGKPNYVYSLRKVEDKNKAVLTKKGVLGMNGDINLTEGLKTGNNMAGTVDYTIPEFEKNFKVKSFITPKNDTLSFYFPFIADTTAEYKNAIKDGKKLNYLFIPVEGSEVQPNEKGNLEIISSQGLYEFDLDTARSKDIKSITRTDSTMKITPKKDTITTKTPSECYKVFKSAHNKTNLNAYKEAGELSKSEQTDNGYGKKFKHRYKIPCEVASKLNLSKSLNIITLNVPEKTKTSYVTTNDTTYTPFTTTKKSFLNLSYPTKEDAVAINKDQTKAGQVESLGYEGNVKKTKKKRNFHINLSNLRAEASVGGYLGGFANPTSGASVSGALQFQPKEGIWVGGYATYTPEYFSNESISETKSQAPKITPLDIDGNLDGIHTITYDQIDSSMTKNTNVKIPYGFGIQTDIKTGENSELELKLGVANKLTSTSTTGTKDICQYLTTNNRDEVLDTIPLMEPQHLESNQPVVKTENEFIPSISAGYKQFFGKNNRFSVTPSITYRGDGDTSGKISVAYTFQKSKK